MELNDYYKKVIKEAKKHYENFPVISLFIPGEFLHHIAVVYKFARTADDIADEGEFLPQERIKKLQKFRNDLSLALMGRSPSEFWESIANTIQKFNLSSRYFYDLLDAFEQDIGKNRYKNLNELLNYCKKSANPVGRILLEMFNIRDDESFLQSDFICTALQLTNMWQDVSVDLQKKRIYLPQDLLKKYGITESELLNNINTKAVKDLMKYLVKYTESLFYKGRGLLNKLPLRFKIQINTTIYGGLLILRKIEKIDYNVLNCRVNLNKFDFLFLFIKGILTYE